MTSAGSGPAASTRSPCRSLRCRPARPSRRAIYRKPCDAQRHANRPEAFQGLSSAWWLNLAGPASRREVGGGGPNEQCNALAASTGNGRRTERRHRLAELACARSGVVQSDQLQRRKPRRRPVECRFHRLVRSDDDGPRSSARNGASWHGHVASDENTRRYALPPLPDSISSSVSSDSGAVDVQRYPTSLALYPFPLPAAAQHAATLLRSAR